MPLVDYASDSDASASNPDPPDTDTDNPPPKKKPRTGTAAESPPRNPGPGPGTTSTPASTTTSTPLPPLPAAFHDLYASTVRTTTRDDPTLHQGRTRQTPHVPGTWPSHVYIEWHPPPVIHSLLTELISSLQEEEQQQRVEITSFLQSDLRAPLPLHISLSRPLALPTASKDGFLTDVQGAVAGGGGGIAAFELRCSGRVEWHRTVESGRSFLVLRVHSTSTSTTSSTQTARATAGEDPNPNTELTGLLRRCNAVVARHGQPGLYQWAEEAGEEGGDKKLGEAFHVSIAWSFAEPTEELVAATERVFGGREARTKIQGVQIPVDGVKVKIGNVVTHVALQQPGRRAGGKGARNLLGL